MPARPAARRLGPTTLRPLGEPDTEGRYRWRVEWYPEGARGRMLSRGLGRQTTAQAERIAARLVADGLPTVAAHQRGEASDVRTVRDLLEAWLGHLDTLADMSQRTRDLRFRVCRQVSLGLGHVRLDRLSTADLEGYRDQRRRQGGAASTVDLHLRTLRAAWRWGRSAGLVEDRHLAVPKTRGPRVYSHRTPTAGEVAATLEHAATPQAHLGIVLLWCTGARVGEVCALLAGDVDRRRGVVTIRTGKTGGRVVPLSERAVAELEPYAELPADVPLVGLTTRGLDAAIRRAAKRAGVAPWSAHGLRRLVVDELLRSGVDLATAATVTGHSVHTMLTAYRQPTDRDRAEAVARARLGEAPAGVVVPMRRRDG